MYKITIIYGSTTGITEAVAERLAELLECKSVNVSSATVEDFDADLLVLGSSTWGVGDLQDDWATTGIALIDSIDLKDKKFAVFGTGDFIGFTDSFCAAISKLADFAESKGAVNVGAINPADYSFHSISSEIFQNGTLVGLPLDEMNAADRTNSRLEQWSEQLKAALSNTATA